MWYGVSQCVEMVAMLVSNGVLFVDELLVNRNSFQIHAGDRNQLASGLKLLYMESGKLVVG